MNNIQCMNQIIQVISERCKAYHNSNLIGRLGGSFLFKTDIDEERCRNKNMNGIDPGPGGMLGQFEKEFVAMID